jgi:hypothetical protein
MENINIPSKWDADVFFWRPEEPGEALKTEPDLASFIG